MKNKTFILSISFVLISLLTQPSLAEGLKNNSPATNAKGTYKWVTPDGKIYYSNSIPPEANQNEINAITKAGNLKKHSSAQKTPEEIEKDNIEKEKEAALAKQEKILNRKLKILQERYSSQEQFDETISKLNHDWNERLAPIKERKKELSSSLQEAQQSQDTEKINSLKMIIEKTDIYIDALEDQYKFELQKITDDKKMWIDFIQKK